MVAQSLHLLLRLHSGEAKSIALRGRMVRIDSNTGVILPLMSHVGLVVLYCVGSTDCHNPLLAAT